MANDLLITAIREAGLDLDDLAAVADVDPRTAQRWLGGRVPHPRYRHKLCAALHASEADLWPDAVNIRRKTDLEEIAGAWAKASDRQAVDWRALLRAANEQVDLLGYSLHEVLQARGIPKQLESKAADGCLVRIAIANPDSDSVIAADLAQRPAGRLTRRINASRHQLQRVTSNSSVQCREHRVGTTHSLLRFDEHLLLTIHLHATPGQEAPLIHLRRRADYGIFDQLARHFEDVWATAEPIQPADEPLERQATPKHSAADKILDELDYVWRPDT